MSKIDEVKTELSELRRKIRKYSKQYYDDNESEISDYDFDMLMMRLKKLEAEYPELITKNSHRGRLSTARSRRTCSS